ncbi:unnamed protein product, partial [Rotaria sp. Silwood2]
AQYFSDFGVNHGIIEFIEQQDESADGLFANIKYILESHELELEKLSSLGSDNTNVNVGNKHSVFSLFNELIPLLVILQHIRTRWLSLLLSIERLIAIYPVVKSYSLNLKDGTCPKILLDFFTSHKGECTLFFFEEYIFGAKLMELLEKIQDSNEVEDLIKSFRLFIYTIITYREDYFEDRASFYGCISIFNEVDIQKLEWRNIERCAAYIDTKKIDKDLLYNDFNHLKSKSVQLKDKFSGIDKQVQEFISSNLHLYKQDGTMSNDEVKLCSGGECDVEAESGSDDEDNIRYHKNV